MGLYLVTRPITLRTHTGKVSFTLNTLSSGTTKKILPKMAGLDTDMLSFLNCFLMAWNSPSLEYPEKPSHLSPLMKQQIKTPMYCPSVVSAWNVSMMDVASSRLFVSEESLVCSTSTGSLWTMISSVIWFVCYSSAVDSCTIWWRFIP